VKVVLFDAMNLIHRSRNTFSKGNHALTYSFFRSFKPLLEKLQPDLAYFVLEGKPKHRTQVYDGYKSNRPSQPDSFWRQQGEILQIMQNLPIIQIRHPDYECDDVIANLAKHHTETGNSVVIVSGDSDFIQVFDSMDHERIDIYHPIKKSFVEKPDHVYLDWKSLRGDVSDNIPGIKGVGDKTATKIINDPELMKETLSDPLKRQIFKRNQELIAFHWFKDLTNDMQNEGVEILYPTPSMENVLEVFTQMGFETMLTERYWPKFENAFNTLKINVR
jgi:DNA polymerase-1